MEEPYGNLHHFYQFHGTRSQNDQRPSGRLAAGRQVFEANGGKLFQYYLTLGAQDAVVVYEFPDDETAASMMLAQAGLGNLRTTTLRAFTEAEIPGVISKVSIS